MILPDAYRDELFARFREDIADNKLRQILALMQMDMPVELLPHFDDLAAWEEFTGENQHRGAVPLTATLQVLGHKRKLHLRYVFVAELEPGKREEIRADAGRLEMLTWGICQSSAAWQHIPIDLLDNSMQAEIDELLFGSITAEKTTASP